MEENKEKNKNVLLFLGCLVIALSIIFSSAGINLAIIDPEQLSNTTLLVNITDPLDSRGNLEVILQDQITPPIDFYFVQGKIVTTLEQNGFIDNLSITVNSSVGCDVGDYLGIFDLIEKERFYLAEILTINGNDIGLDTPLDYDFLQDSVVVCTNRELNVDGSTTTQTFVIKGASLNSTLEIDITRIMFKMICTEPPEFSMFCDIAGGITKGIVLRRVNNETRNIFNVKTNGELANLMYDLTFYEQIKVQGVNGIIGRYTFAGQSKHGVAVRLEPGDELQLLIQDDLTSLESFRIIAEGHIVEN